MNDQKLEKKVRHDADKVRKDLRTLVEDGAAQVSQATGKAREDLTTWVEDGLCQYNARAQEYADRVPGGFSKKAARYPWVTISIALAVGFLLGSLRKPARQSLG